MAGPNDRQDGELRTQISTAMVKLLREHSGRGPTRARTYVSDDIVTVILHDTLSGPEHKLIDGGEDRFVLELRHRFQLAMADEATEMVERLTGRKVSAFMSANHLEPDVAAELFVLEPLPGD